MNKKITQFRWLAATIMLVAAMVMPSVAWAQSYDTNGFGSGSDPYQPATKTTDKYDIDGDGTKDEVYEIGNAGQLYWFADKVNNENVTYRSANAVLTANITVNSKLLEKLNPDGTAKEGYEVRNWTPIGWYDNANSVDYYYSGTFDGNDNTISGLYYNGTISASDYDFYSVGFFGRNAGTIKDVGVENSYFELKYSGSFCYFGGVCGTNKGSGVIKNCNFTGTVIATVKISLSSRGYGTFIGGVCGSNVGEIKDCINSGKIETTTLEDSYLYYVGGVCGRNYNATIENCTNKGEVGGTDNVGGVCGYNCAYNGSPKIESCSNTGKVSGTNNVGGVCGNNAVQYGDYAVTITNCYNTGEVTGTGYGVGGVSGSNDGVEGGVISTITNCYNSGKVNGNYVSGVIGLVYDYIEVTNCYYLSETATDDGGKTEGQFKSGEVCYLLNNCNTDGSQAWYQTLSDSGEGYPNLNKDAENRTVYGAYKHGETSPTCSNSNSDLAMFHAHAYDSSAIDEANGNHDMACEQNENNPYTWEDIDNYSNATAKCNFICSVCNSKVSKDMTVTPDGDKTYVPAQCEEIGYNYYKASLTFNGKSYTYDYTQEVPGLGHDKSGDVTFNSGKSIYEKVCKRDGCNEVVGYYATSDGSVEAKYEDGVYKVPFFGLDDGLAYDNEAKFTVEDLTYTRTFSHDKWVAVYVPFAIDCSQLQNDNRVEMAVINNFHEYEQTDGSYNVVLEVKRKTSGTIPALTPCVMRSMAAAPIGGTVTHYINLSNAVFSPAADKYIDCSSVERYYKFTGSLAGIEKYIFNEVTDFVLNEGTLYKANHETTLKAQRWYLSAEDRSISSTSSAAMLRSISINVIGDSDGDVTGIEDIHVVTEKVTSVRDGIFDLQGRRLNSEPTKGMYIKNGVKYVK